MQGGKAWVRRAYSGALNGLKNGVVSVLWKSAIGPFSILVFLYIMFVVAILVFLYIMFVVAPTALSHTTFSCVV